MFMCVNYADDEKGTISSLAFPVPTNAYKNVNALPSKEEKKKVLKHMFDTMST